VEARLSVVNCVAACDVVHTMTSLTGFDALLRGKRVVVYGQPFYAGWGLTEDVLQEGAAFARRQRRLSLDALVAGTLLRYPIYWDWDLKGYTTCEAVLHRIVETRSALEASGGLEKLRLVRLRLTHTQHQGIFHRRLRGTSYNSGAARRGRITAPQPRTANGCRSTWRRSSDSRCHCSAMKRPDGPGPTAMVTM
jgi:capsular polysaccharide export protein